MKTTLLGSQKPPLHLHFPKPTHYNPTTTAFIHPKTIQNRINYPTTTWKLQANNAKGFGNNNNNSRPDQNVTTTPSKISNNNNGNNDDDQLPEVVLNRIIVRILVAVGVPLATGIALLNIIGVVKEQHIWDVPIWVPLVTTFITFGSSAVGIAYGPLSTSWDAEKKGSLLGFEEAKQNWVEMWKEENDM